MYNKRATKKPKGAPKMQELKQELKSNMQQARVRVVDFRLQELENILDPTTLKYMKEFCVESSTTDACHLDTTNPVTYAILLKEYLTLEREFYYEMRPSMAEFENVEYNELLQEIYETDFFHFLDMFSEWAKENIDSDRMATLLGKGV